MRRYTIVNEPLTTARFSALYGVWYPHGSDDRLFVKALLNECRATVTAMAAIRAVTPGAQFVQTEDICRVDARPALAERAAFYNERRWLSLDLLCGVVRTDHAVWSYLCRSSASHADLQFFLVHDGSPDVIGMNYYLTSDRLLDDRVDRYPDRVPDLPPPPPADRARARLQRAGTKAPISATRTHCNNVTVTVSAGADGSFDIRRRDRGAGTADSDSSRVGMLPGSKRWTGLMNGRTRIATAGRAARRCRYLLETHPTEDVRHYRGRAHQRILRT